MKTMKTKRRKHNLLVFYIDVQNMNTKEIPTYMKKVKNQIGKLPSFIDLSFFIPIRGDGSKTRIESLTL